MVPQGQCFERGREGGKDKGQGKERVGEDKDQRRDPYGRQAGEPGEKEKPQREHDGGDGQIGKDREAEQSPADCSMGLERARHAERNAQGDRQHGAERADDKAGGRCLPKGRLREDGRDGGQAFAQDAGQRSEKAGEEDDEQNRLHRCEPTPFGPVHIGTGAKKRGGGGERRRGNDDGGADEELDEGEIDGGAKVEIEPDGFVDGDLERLVGGAAAQGQDHGEAGKAQEEYGGRDAGDGRGQGRQIDDREALDWTEAQAAAELELFGRDGGEPVDEDAGRKGAVEHHMGRDDAPEPKDRGTRLKTERGEHEIDPAIAAPDGQEPRNDHQRWHDQRRREQADDQSAAGEAQPIESPGQDQPGKNGKKRREAGLGGRYGHDTADAGNAGPGGGEALAGDPEGDEQGGDQNGDRGGKQSAGEAAAGTPGWSCPGHMGYLSVAKASSIQARVLAVTSSASSKSAGAGSIISAKPGLRPPAGSSTGYIQLVSGRAAWASGVTR